MTVLFCGKYYQEPLINLLLQGVRLYNLFVQEWHLMTALYHRTK